MEDLFALSGCTKAANLRLPSLLAQVGNARQFTLIMWGLSQITVQLECILGPFCL